MCLKIAFREMCVPVCGRFVSNEGGVAGYVDRMRGKYTAKWGVQIAGMNFQTRSKMGFPIQRTLFYFCICIDFVSFSYDVEKDEDGHFYEEFEVFPGGLYVVGVGFLVGGVGACTTFQYQCL